MTSKWIPNLASVPSSQASVATSTASSTGNIKTGHVAVALPSTSLDQAKLKGENSTITARARRRREEAVRRLVADVHRRPDGTIGGGAATMMPTSSLSQQEHDWLVASTVATALERGLDRDLHAELVQECKDNSSRIGQVCHADGDGFLQSVGSVVTLISSSVNSLQRDIHQASEELTSNETAGRMLKAAEWWHHCKTSAERAQATRHLVQSCLDVAVLLQRARKQASLGRPRAALDAVDEARQLLTAPAVRGTSGQRLLLQSGATAASGGASDNAAALDASAVVDGTTAAAGATSTSSTTAKPSTVVLRLQETPFGARAMEMLPKIENEVLMGARRGLNRWFLALRSGGDGAKAGRAVLRKCAHSMAVGGPGQLGLGGHVPPSYMWRAKTADNFCSRLDQNGRVARAVRLGYWFERDATKESERLERVALPGMERRAEAFAAAFGWYRCWDDNEALMVDIAEMNLPDTHSSVHGAASSGLSGSRHGLGGSRHGSRHGRRTLGFRASTQSKTASSKIELRTSTTTSKSGKDKKRSPWAELLTPPIIFEDAPTRKEDDVKLIELPEAVHPVRRAEQAFKLLGRHEEFIQYYEQNRFGDMQIGGAKGSDKKESRSSLSSLTGDDVTVGTDRIFFAKSLSHLCASVVGFSAVEAALEVGNFGDDDEEDPFRSTVAAEVKATSDSAARFRDSSARYERSLVTELGMRLRSRAIGASLAELARASCLMAAFRSALKIVHPSSTTRRSDKELLAMDVDIVMTALKVAQDEQLKATARIVIDDRREPMVVPLSELSRGDSRSSSSKKIPDEELLGLPFGLNDLRQKLSEKDEELEDRRYRQGPKDEFYTFSQSVPQVVRSVHARCIACAAFALSQEELGQVFSQKKGSSGVASYVLDCAEACVSVAAVGMQDNDNVVDEGSVEKAVQTMANIHALQHCLPRLFGTMMRGMCHVGMVRADQLEETFQYAETTLKGADKACDAQVGSCYTLLYEICRNKIDAHLNYALDGFSWVAKSARDMPNAYCEGLIGYMRSVFAALGPIDEGSRAGLHFSCCGHVAERLVKILTDKPASEGQGTGDDALAPISRIDAFGIKNMALDVQEFESFCEGTGVPQLKECFNELKCLTSAMLDRDLPTLLEPGSAAKRQRKYPFLSIEKIGNILEKYVGQGLGDQLMGRSGKSSEILLMEKKEVTNLLKLCRTQQK